MSMKTQVQVPGIHVKSGTVAYVCHLSSPNSNVKAETGEPPGAHSSGEESLTQVRRGPTRSPMPHNPTMMLCTTTDSEQWNRATANGSF